MVTIPRVDRTVNLPVNGSVAVVIVADEGVRCNDDDDDDDAVNATTAGAAPRKKWQTTRADAARARMLFETILNLREMRTESD